MSSAIVVPRRSGGAIVLAAVCLAALVLPLDFSGAAAATAAIGQTFGDSALMLAWVVNAFMLTFGSTLLTAGALADAYGRKRVFAVGLGGFVVTSVAICVAPNLLVLDLLRSIQGLAAAATLAGGSAALAQEFDGVARTRAFSLLGTTFGVGLAFGPTIAGALLEASGWRAIFLVGAAVGALALAVSVPLMNESRDPAPRQPDWWGAATFTAALALLTAGLLQAAADGWASAVSLALLVAAAVLFFVFVFAERRVTDPMLDLSLFRYPRFVGVQLLPIATCYSYVVLLVLLPARFMGVEGHTPLHAGILMLALSLPMLVVPFATAVLTRWLSPGPLSAIGLAIAAVGLMWLADIAPGTSSWGIAAPLVVIGFGTAMPWGLMDGLSVEMVPKERAGMATGIFSTVRVAGEGMALAVVRTILAWLVGAQVAGPDRGVAAVIAAGDLSRAAELAPTLGHQDLIAVYGAAFATLVYVLAAIVVVASLLVLCILRSNRG